MKDCMVCAATILGGEERCKHCGGLAPAATDLEKVQRLTLVTAAFSVLSVRGSTKTAVKMLERAGLWDARNYVFDGQSAEAGARAVIAACVRLGLLPPEVRTP